MALVLAGWLLLDKYWQEQLGTRRGKIACSWAGKDPHFRLLLCIHLPPAGVPSLDRLAAFAADWLRSRHSHPASRLRLPHVLSNRSVLCSGQSLKYISHPWLPLCILGYAAGRGGSSSGDG